MEILFADLARAGDLPPNGFMAPKAWEILAEYYRSKWNEWKKINDKFFDKFF